jgi:hypothetical protein
MNKLMMAATAIGLCLAPVFLNAETITGKVTDKKGLPIPAATVSLKPLADTLANRQGLTLSDGTFSFEKLKSGLYRIRITSIGSVNYQSDSLTIDEAHRLIRLPGITLRTAEKALKEVVISSQKSILEQRSTGQWLTLTPSSVMPVPPPWKY